MLHKLYQTSPWIHSGDKNLPNGDKPSHVQCAKEYQELFVQAWRIVWFNTSFSMLPMTFAMSLLDLLHGPIPIPAKVSSMTNGNYQSYLNWLTSSLLSNKCAHSSSNSATLTTGLNFKLMTMLKTSLLKNQRNLLQTITSISCIKKMPKISILLVESHSKLSSWVTFILISITLQAWTTIVASHCAADMIAARHQLKKELLENGVIINAIQMYLHLITFYNISRMISSQILPSGAVILFLTTLNPSIKRTSQTWSKE